MLANQYAACGQVFDPYVLAVIMASSIYGLFVGAVPGLSATMAVALLVPVTFFMPPVPAIAAMVTATAMGQHVRIAPVVNGPWPRPLSR